MLTRIFWVPEIAPYRLALMPRPQGGEALSDEVMNWRVARVDTVVSLLEPEEIAYLDLAEEGAFCEGAGIEFLSFPIGDRGIPRDPSGAKLFVESLAERLRDGRAVCVHCRVGIGRSSLICACVLLHLGMPYSQVFELLSHARGTSVPDTQEQAQWVFDYSLRLEA